MDTNNNTSISSRDPFLDSDGLFDDFKLSLLAGVVTAPLVEAMWSISNDKRDVLNRLYTLACRQYKLGLYVDVMEMIHLLYDALGLDMLLAHSEYTDDFRIAESIVDQFIADLQELMQDLFEDYEHE